MPTEIDHIEKRIDALHDDVRKVLNYCEGGQGFHVRLDRIEQQAEKTKWWTRAALGAALAAGAGVISRWGSSPH